MNNGSLKVRLLAGGALWVLMALILAGVAIFYLFVTNIERSIDAELSANAARMTALLDTLSDDGPQLTEYPPDPRYDIPFSGYYWQIEDDSGNMLRSRSLWDYEIPYTAPASAEGPQPFEAMGPYGQSLSGVGIAARFDLPDGSRTYSVVTARDRSLLNESISRFGADLATALLALAIALVFAAMAQVALGLRPLRALRQDIEMVRTGKRNAITSTYPEEVLPLVAEVNALLASQERLIEFARSRASDLAHGLKTPLSVMGAIADQLRDVGDHANADQIEDLVSEMSERIDYQLRMSRLRQRAGNQVLSTPLDEVLVRVISVISRTARSENLEWDIDYGEKMYLDIDRNDLVELLGILLENATEWASRRITVSCRQDTDGGLIRICDDGGTLSPGDLERFANPGRLDERAHGNGLGLGIAKEIVAVNEGRMDFALSPENGLDVTIRLPLGNHPAPDEIPEKTRKAGQRAG